MGKFWCFFGMHTFGHEIGRGHKVFGRQYYAHRCHVCNKIIYDNIKSYKDGKGT